MTTRQGESYLKKKLFPVIENMEDETKADTTKNIKSEANPVPYSKVEATNKEHATNALELCKQKCKTITQVEACNLGCQIKFEGNSDSTDTLTEAKYLANPYDRWKKSYSIVVDKKSDIKIADKYKKWAPYHTYGNIWNGWKKWYYYYWTYYWRRGCFSYWWWWRTRRSCYWYTSWYRKRTYTWIPNYRWGITKRGTRVTVPEVREKCHWKELHKYPKENTGRFDDIVEAKGCDDIMTNDKIPDPDPDYYRDYSIHNMVDACNYGIDNYERQNCKVNQVDNKTITCGETRSYGSIEFDTQNYEEELAKTKALTEASTETFTNKKKKEGFSNACKSKCSTIETEEDIIGMNSSHDCYKCEVKYNPYIRYSAPREKLIKEARYKANNQLQLNPKLYKLKREQQSQKRKLDIKKGEQTTLANRNKTFLDELNPIHPIKGGNPDLSVSQNDCKDYAQNKGFGYTVTNEIDKPKGCYVRNPLPDVNFNTNQQATGVCGTVQKSQNPNVEDIKFNCLQRVPSKYYSKKRHVTINAYLEDMKTRNPSKNIEYGIWIGLLAAAGISTAVLLKD